jgi:hypothetical protein
MTRGVAHASYTIQVESAGNARITDRTGDVVGVLEDWRLWVNGRDVGEVSTYNEAMERVRQCTT